MGQAREPLTRDYIQSLIAGPVIDELMATHVMGWHKAHAGVQDPPNPYVDYWTDDANKVLMWCDLWEPSVNIAQTWQAVDKLIANGWEFGLDWAMWYVPDADTNAWRWWATIRRGADIHVNIAETLMLAICHALLLGTT